VASATLNTLRNFGMVCSFAVSLSVAASSMPPRLVNAVFLGTVGHLAPVYANALTMGMSHAFIASAIICVIAIFFSIVRESRAVTAVAVPAAREEAAGAGATAKRA
jgi:uncharacterized membrane protein YjjB (DUF3815 family)